MVAPGICRGQHLALALVRLLRRSDTSVCVACLRCPAPLVLIGGRQANLCSSASEPAFRLVSTGRHCLPFDLCCRSSDLSALFRMFESNPIVGLAIKPTVDSHCNPKLSGSQKIIREGSNCWIYKNSQFLLLNLWLMLPKFKELFFRNAKSVLQNAKPASRPEALYR